MIMYFILYSTFQINNIYLLLDPQLINTLSPNFTSKTNSKKKKQ